ncbi:SDR family NAD(P)-dependent oxidoreductase [Jatrophihabitans telluris]|uniref:SDR family NAD(P)-dependent oxidoreductase n=1 Tax=Jatrophihabitans telluris TaxID=2038343 RepID=A0ABY4QW76_9ACTN|nr:SDR family NAD(P)-dependent oxidoreductase [Jatrophihabitans telluris]UQX87889.1 SDR family NAD(P)-dependent oxidoreductase [Jatrophihabitans telluris]
MSVTAVVTGSSSGIGLFTAVELARSGHRVVLACRDQDRASRARDRVRALVPGAAVEARPLELGSLDSIRAFADSWDGPLDLLVNNAGVMAPRRWRATSDGFELQFGVNHLGHFALTGLLLPALLAAPAPRVVTVSSLAHRSGTAGVLFGNPESSYRPQQAYSESKLANLLFALELQRRADEAGSVLTSTAAHPGISATNLFLTDEGLGANPVIKGLGRVFGRVVLQSAAAGARPSLLAATTAAAGSYSGPRWGEVRGPAGAAQPSATARDEGLADQLWDLSTELTGVKYEWTT